MLGVLFYVHKTFSQWLEVNTRWYGDDADFVNDGDGHVYSPPIAIPKKGCGITVSTTGSFTLNKNMIYGSMILTDGRISILLCREGYYVGIAVKCFMICY